MPIIYLWLWLWSLELEGKWIVHIPHLSFFCDFTQFRILYFFYLLHKWVWVYRMYYICFIRDSLSAFSPLAKWVSEWLRRASDIMAQSISLTLSLSLTHLFSFPAHYPNVHCAPCSYLFRLRKAKCCRVGMRHELTTRGYIDVHCTYRRNYGM